MKPSFSLKWLFISIVFLAVLCGWIASDQRWRAEHRRLTGELQDAEERLEDLHSDKGSMLMFLFLADGTLTEYDWENDTVNLEDGELSERCAYAISASGFPTVTLFKVRVAPEAHELMRGNYDLEGDGDNRTYRLRSGSAK
ncbi:MAG: hypothetical protein U0836_04420 [Pirellulales bacterium]